MMAEYWFTCPRCHKMASIDEDQANARVSIDCPTEWCNFHETGWVGPLIPTTVATKPSDAPNYLFAEREAMLKRYAYDSFDGPKGRDDGKA